LSPHHCPPTPDIRRSCHRRRRCRRRRRRRLRRLRRRRRRRRRRHADASLSVLRGLSYLGVHGI